MPERRLRLPVKLFNIKIRNKIFNLKTLFKINKEVVKNKIKFTISDDIKDILFDTGNELNYSCVSEYYYNYFKNNPIFFSRFGFLSNIAENWLYTINFGIECVRQFFSILLLDKDRLYFYLKRI